VSDDFGRGYPGDDPFVDAGDPEAVARAERRREREEKRASKSGRKAPKAPAPPPPPKETPPTAPRTPEQEFWDEPADPAAEPPAPGAAPADLPKPEPEKKGRRGFLGRRRKEAEVGAAAAAGAAPSEPAAPEPSKPAALGPPTAETPLPKPSALGSADPKSAPDGPPTAEAPTAKSSDATPPTSEAQAAKASDATPPTAEAPAPKAPPTPSGESPTGEQPTAIAPAAATGGKAAVEPVGPPTAEQPMPKLPGQPDDKAPSGDAAKVGAAGAAAGSAAGDAPGAEEKKRSDAAKAAGAAAAGAAAGAGAAAAAASGSPRVDPGSHTADSPRPDPNQPTSADAIPGDAAGPSTREHLAQPPRPVEETGAGDWEPPPPRDDDWFDTGEHFHDEGDPEMTGAARTGRRHNDDNRGRGILGRIFRHPFLIFGAIVLILVLIFLNGFFQPFHGDGNGKVVVDIPKGSSVGEVGDLLEKKGVISGGTLFVSGSTMFQGRVTLAGKRSDLFAGKFVMAKDMSYGDAIDQLSEEPKPKQEATAKPGVVTVTIPEGQSRPITAKLLKEDGVKGSYLNATKKSKILSPAEYGGKGAKDLEGFLFPDTWDYKTKQPVKHLVALQLKDFKKQIKKVNMKYAKSKNLTVYDVVTIASIIEREAGVAKQRKDVASVIYNRLHEGMTLGMDSTIRFATGNYEKPLTQSELESESPYNTRVTPGLPPGPINSPGLAAINAAAHPAKTDYLFFVNNPNSCNELAFAKTEEEFLEDEAKYAKAREKNGGNQPSTCK
jgi:UPF0755 protein